MYYSKTFCPSTSVVKASRAFSTIPRRNFFSSSLSSAGFPSGCGIATAGTILYTTGIPALSISFTIVAPQRVQVPQVEVRITASTPSAFNFCEYSAANAFADATDVPFPTVA